MRRTLGEPVHELFSLKFSAIFYRFTFNRFTQALACYMLRQLPEYSEARIVRSRKTEVLASCDIVVDVGGVYDPAIHRYDHHQR